VKHLTSNLPLAFPLILALALTLTLALALALALALTLTLIQIGGMDHLFSILSRNVIAQHV